MAGTKAPPHTSYAALNTITDPAIKQVLKLLFDKVAAVEQQTPDIGTLSQPLTTPLDFNGQRGIGLADPADSTDAVNLQTMQRYVGAAIKAAVP